MSTEVSASLAAPDERVCPACGQRATSGSFCVACGANLGPVDRLRSQEDSKRSDALAAAQTIAARLATINPITPGVFDVPVEERSLEHRAAIEVVERAIAKAVEESIPRAERSPQFAVDVRHRSIGPTAMQATACVTIANGRRVEQSFECRVEAGKPRAQVRRSGPPVLANAAGVEIAPLPAGGRETQEDLQASASLGTDKKVCPECAEDVKLAANVCRFCGHHFEREPAASRHNPLGQSDPPNLRANTRHPAPGLSRASENTRSALAQSFWVAVAGIIAMAIGAFGPWASALGGLVTINGTSGQRDGWIVLAAALAAAFFLALYFSRRGTGSALTAGAMALLAGGVCVYDLVDITNTSVTLHPEWGIYVALAGAVTTLITSVLLAVTGGSVE